MATLDELIVKAEKEAKRPGKIRGRSSQPPPPPKAKVPAKPEPGEPELAVAPMVSPGGNRFRREQRNQMLADERRRTFARELFFTGFNQQEALQRAGYRTSASRWRMIAAELLTHPIVAGELKRLSLVAQQAIDAKTIDLTKNWMDIAEGDIFEFLRQDEEGYIHIRAGLDQLPVEKRRLIKRVKVKKRVEFGKDDKQIVTVETDLELYDRLTALECLGKVQGIFEDKTANAITDFAAKLTDRLNQAAKRVGRTFENGALVPSDG